MSVCFTKHRKYAYKYLLPDITQLHWERSKEGGGVGGFAFTTPAK